LVAVKSKFVIPIPDLRASSEDDKATREAIGYATGLDISKKETDNKLNTLDRTDSIGWHIHCVLVSTIWIAGLMLLFCSVVFILHLAGPDSWRFLDAQRYLELKNFLFSGTFGAGLATLAKSKLGLTDDKNK
jgi:hypothetical protein